MELTPFLKTLLSTSGLSGYESPAAKLIEEAWKPLVDEIQYSKIGSLEALKKGSAADAPKIMLAAHMDAIGMMVTQNVDGFLRVTQVGGVDARVLPGTPVTVPGPVTHRYRSRPTKRNSGAGAAATRHRTTAPSPTSN